MTEEEARKKRRRERVVGGIDATAGMLQNAGSALLGAASFGTNLVMPYLKGLEANAVEQYNINKAQPSYSGDKGFMKLGGMIRKYPMGGQVPYEQDTPIQTEKGEKIISGAHVYDVKAKEKHEQMEEDVVTDILKGGDFIVSDRKTMSIDRAAADNMIVGTPIPFYSEHAYLPMEQPHTLGDIFGKKKKLTPADIAQRIKNKFPLSEREDDALSSHADELNLQNRIAYLEALKQLNVDNIPKAEEAEIEQMIADEAEVPQFKHGGHVRKYQNGGDPTNPPKGIKPYVTSDPNDPRIQAYRDSLTMSNLGKADPFLKLADNIPNLTKREYLRKQEALFNSRPFTEKHAQARDRLNKYNPSGVEPLSTTRFNKISKDGVEIYGAVSEWKNPQQEVIYRENTPPLAPLDTLQPQQLPSQEREFQVQTFQPDPQFRITERWSGSAGAPLFLDNAGKPTYQRTDNPAPNPMQHDVQVFDRMNYKEGKRTLKTNFEYGGEVGNYATGGFIDPALMARIGSQVIGDFEANQSGYINSNKLLPKLGRVWDETSHIQSPAPQSVLDNLDQIVSPEAATASREYLEAGGEPLSMNYIYNNVVNDGTWGVSKNLTRSALPDRPVSTRENPIYNTEGELTGPTIPSNIPKAFKNSPVATTSATSTVAPKSMFDGKRGDSSGDEFGDYLNNKLASLDSVYADQRRKGNRAYGQQMGYLGLGSTLGVVGSMIQDPTEVAPQYNTAYARAMPQEIPRQVYEANANKINQGMRPVTRAVFENTPYFSQAVGSLSTIPANVANAQSDLAGQMAVQNVGLRQQYLQANQAIDMQQRNVTADAANRQSANSNQKIAQATQYGVNFATQAAAANAANMTYQGKALAARNLNEQVLMQNKLQYEELRRLYGKR